MLNNRSWNLLNQVFFHIMFAAAAAKSLQSCSTLCGPIDSNPPGSTVPGILQARTLEWVAISFSSAWKWKGKVKSFSSVRLVATPWTAAHQAPPSMGVSRQEYWSGVPLPSPYNVCSLIDWHKLKETSLVVYFFSTIAHLWVYKKRQQEIYKRLNAQRCLL